MPKSPIPGPFAGAHLLGGPRPQPQPPPEGEAMDLTPEEGFVPFYLIGQGLFAVGIYPDGPGMFAPGMIYIKNGYRVINEQVYRVRKFVAMNQVVAHSTIKAPLWWNRRDAIAKELSVSSDTTALPDLSKTYAQLVDCAGRLSTVLTNMIERDKKEK